MFPLCICNGVIRSGSTWSFNVCRELLRDAATATGHPFGSAYLDSQPLEQFLGTQWPTAKAFTVIKAHSLGMNAMTHVRTGKAKLVCTYRDPRDCVASDLAFMQYPLEVCVHRVSGTFTPMRVYQSTPHMLLVRYENMMQDRQAEIRRIARHLGLGVSDVAVQRVDDRTNMESSRKICQQIRNKPANEVVNIATHRVDPETHLHENHINGGAVGKWKTSLTPEQAIFVNENFAPWLLQFGYETTASLSALMRDLYAKTGAPPQRQMTPAQPAAPRLGTFSIGAGLQSA